MTSTTLRPGARAARIGFVAAPFLGLTLAVLLVWQASYSAFSAQTSNPGNNWDAGSVVLTDDDNDDAALFNVGPMAPGDSGEQCIVVTYDGTVDSTVKLYGAGLADTNQLASYLDVRITLGSSVADGTPAGQCTGFTKVTGGTDGDVYGGTTGAPLAGFDETDWATGHPAAGTGLWQPTGANQTRVYKIDYTLNTAADNDQQNGNATVEFIWEAQSNPQA